MHLEATIRPERLLEALGRRNDVKLPARTVAGLERFCRFSGFDRFIVVWIKTTSVLRHRQGLPSGRARLRRRPGGTGLLLRRGAVLALRARDARYAVAGGVRGLLRRRGRGAGDCTAWSFASRPTSRATSRRRPVSSSPDGRLPVPRARRGRYQPGRERAPLPAGAVRARRSRSPARAASRRAPHAGETAGPASVRGGPERRCTPTVCGTACAPSRTRRCSPNWPSAASCCDVDAGEQRAHRRRALAGRAPAAGDARRRRQAARSGATTPCSCRRR